GLGRNGPGGACRPAIARRGRRRVGHARWAGPPLTPGPSARRRRKAANSPARFQEGIARERAAVSPARSPGQARAPPRALPTAPPALPAWAFGPQPAAPASSAPPPAYSDRKPGRSGRLPERAGRRSAGSRTGAGTAGTAPAHLWEAPACRLEGSRPPRWTLPPLPSPLSPARRAPSARDALLNALAPPRCPPEGERAR